MWYDPRQIRPHPSEPTLGREAGTGRVVRVWCKYIPVNGGGNPPVIEYVECLEGVAPFRWPPVVIDGWRYVSDA